MLATHFKQILKLAHRIGFAVGCFLLFFVLIELLQAYETLHGFHPIAGGIFIATVFGIIIWGLVRIYCVFRQFPKAIASPDPKDYGGPNGSKYKTAWLIYLRKYANELLNNPALDSDHQLELQKRLELIPNGIIDKKCEWLENTCIKPALDILNKKAELIVRNTVRDTMTAVMLSPFRSLDSIVVISRNGQMFLELVTLYNHQPGLLHITRYAKEVLVIVTSVNILNFTERLTENLMRNVPILNRTADDMIQGMGAGILTTAVGKATTNRCRAYGRWNKEMEKTNFLKTSAGFASHVRYIFIEDVLPSLGTLWSESWKKVRSAFDTTLSKTQTIVFSNKKKAIVC